MLIKSNISSPRIPQNIKQITKVIYFIKQLSLSGIFKSFILECDYMSKILDFLNQLKSSEEFS